MVNRLALMHTAFNALARGEAPYTRNLFGSNHIRVYKDDAKVLVDVIDELMELRGRAAEMEQLRNENTTLRKGASDGAEYLKRMQAELEIRRANVTTGGPAPAFTSRPEEIVELSVAIPITEEEIVELPGAELGVYGDPDVRDSS